MTFVFARGVALAIMAASIASAAPAPGHKAQLLRRHGIIYGVRGINYGGCEAAEAEDVCRPYKLFGTIVAVFHNPDSHRMEGFTVRTSSGRREMQNVDPQYFPAAALGLIRRGHRVRVSGVWTGEGRIAAPTEIIVEERRQTRFKIQR